ncbi:extracellular tyrosine-protein kinase PKDCC-like [Diadema antillarum]|uniref:extracellular tyrosine-protein kinase PKDCC-like n=1 Tax=Diadema antillarum TaxID=105358 RepID=UPI003A89D080
MLNFKRIFFRTPRKTVTRARWLTAMYIFVFVLMVNHCSAVLGLHLDLLEKHPDMGFNPEFIQANTSGKFLTCRDISRMQQVAPIGKGTTKEVFGGTFRGRGVAIKMVTPSVKDVQLCFNKRAYRQKEECYEYANYKLMKEIAYSLQLSNERILKLLGFCVRGDAVTGSVRDQGIVSVVEVGKKLSEYRLKQFTWAERLQVGSDIAELLVFLENSPLGSLEIGDLKLSQFIMVDGRIKLGDLDDMSSEERRCQKSRDCGILGENAGIECLNSTCMGINAKANVLLATIEILEPLFANPPDRIKGRIDLLLKKLMNYQLDANELHQSLVDLADVFSTLS